MRLIDADALNIHDVSPAYGMCVMGVTEEDIDDAPTVDAVQVRHGHWIKEFENEDGRNLRCSECRMVFYVGKGRDGNYCPNCGARMDEK